MSTVVVSTRPAAPAEVRHLAAPLKAWLVAVVDAAFRFHARRRDESALCAMADYQLRDLGITRSDVPRVVREGR